jgi:CheY-like chemotaxis protein
MPDMDGEHLCKVIKSDPAINATKCILLTSVEQRGDAVRMKDAGFDGYLVKPIDTELLLIVSLLYSVKKQMKMICQLLQDIPLLKMAKNIYVYLLLKTYQPIRN